MNTIKQRLFSGWHFMRIVRLILSLWILVMAIQAHDWAMGLLGAFFLYTALTGVGCCGSAGCYIPPDKAGTKNIKNIDNINKEENGSSTYL